MIENDFNSKKYEGKKLKEILLKGPASIEIIISWILLILLVLFYFLIVCKDPTSIEVLE